MKEDYKKMVKKEIKRIYLDTPGGVKKMSEKEWADWVKEIGGKGMKHPIYGDIGVHLKKYKKVFVSSLWGIRGEL
jgi:hypothetical protein